MAGDFTRRHRQLIVFSVLVSLSFILLFAAYWGVGRFISRAYHTLLYPTQNFLGRTMERISFQANAVQEITRLQEELRQNRERLVELQAGFIEVNRLREEKRELESLLAYKKALDFRGQAARVIAKDPQGLFTTLLLDKGRADGLKEGLPVLTLERGRGALVGKLLEVAEHSCRVQTILDPLCRVSVILEETSDLGLMRGQLPAGMFGCMVEYLDRRLTALDGKAVITSGLGDRYPRGIPVGVLREVDRKRYGLFQRATLEPYVNYFTLEHVYVLIER